MILENVVPMLNINTGIDNRYMIYNAQVIFFNSFKIQKQRDRGLWLKFKYDFLLKQSYSATESPRNDKLTEGQTIPENSQQQGFQ